MYTLLIVDVSASVHVGTHIIHSTYSSEIVTTPYLHLRYDGTDCALMIRSDVEGSSAGCQHGDFEAGFTCRYTYVHIV